MHRAKDESDRGNAPNRPLFRAVDCQNDGQSTHGHGLGGYRSAYHETVQLFEIPYRPSVSPAELHQLINLIESQAKARNPELFSSHVTHMLHQQ